MLANRSDTQSAMLYHRFAPLYEWIFNPFLGARVRLTIRSLQIPLGARVLEVGVGTGLSLAAYPHHASVTGVDLSSEMLAQAERRIAHHRWQHIELRQMDALALDFENEHFDYVFAFYVTSVVADPQRLMREMSRVLKPRGNLVIVNHFRSENEWVASCTDRLDPLTRRLGWRTTLRFSDLFDSVPLRVTDRFKTTRMSLFTIALAEKLAENTDCPPFEKASIPAYCSIRSWKTLRQVAGERKDRPESQALACR
jgi:phosphatidylethanolamine/phosphatidyl-N-methylethanolamine N-methyltransferase